MNKACPTYSIHEFSKGPSQFVVLWQTFGTSRPRDHYLHYNTSPSLLTNPKNNTAVTNNSTTTLLGGMCSFHLQCSKKRCFVAFYPRCLKIRGRRLCIVAEWLGLLERRGSQRLAGCRTAWESLTASSEISRGSFCHSVINKTQDVFLFFPHQRGSGAAKQNNHYRSLLYFPACSLSLPLSLSPTI